MKKSIKLKKYDYVEILWQDTNIPEKGGWMSSEEHAEWTKEATSLVISIGIFISEDKDFINLVGDMEADKGENNNYLRPINIGKGFIQSIDKLMVKKK